LLANAGTRSYRTTIDPVNTRAEVARAAGVSHGTLDKAKVIAENRETIEYLLNLGQVN
jgi:hypothetical protein